VIRFALGGAATVFAGLVSSRYGAFIGGLYVCAKCEHNGAASRDEGETSPSGFACLNIAAVKRRSNIQPCADCTGVRKPSRGEASLLEIFASLAERISKRPISAQDRRRRSQRRLSRMAKGLKNPPFQH
jgi:hypothetical protein